VLALVLPSRLRRLSVLRSARTCELLVGVCTLNLGSGWELEGGGLTDQKAQWYRIGSCQRVE
jgi:hypothetical protein